MTHVPASLAAALTVALLMPLQYELTKSCRVAYLIVSVARVWMPSLCAAATLPT